MIRFSALLPISAPFPLECVFVNKRPHFKESSFNKGKVSLFAGDKDPFDRITESDVKGSALESFYLFLCK